MGKAISPTDADKEKRRFLTFPLLIIGIYLTLFVIASQRYEYKVRIIKDRANVIFAQTNTPYFKKAISRIPTVQQMECPVKPDIKDPVSIFHSFLVDTTLPEMVEQLKEAVEMRKTGLDSVNLIGADLVGVNLMGAHLMGGNLSKTDFMGADLYGADLSAANLAGANLARANLVKANLNRADLMETNLRKANLIETVFMGANLMGANLAEANLWEAKLLTIEQLSKVKTLYQVQNLAPELREQIEQNYPHLLEKLEEEE